MPHILVVDDDPEIPPPARQISRWAGISRQPGRKPAECETRLADSRVDLLVLDVMLPDGSGLDLCRTLRDRMPQLSVILLTH